MTINGLTVYPKTARVTTAIGGGYRVAVDVALEQGAFSDGQVTLGPYRELVTAEAVATAVRKLPAKDKYGREAAHRSQDIAAPFVKGERRLNPRRRGRKEAAGK